MGRAPHPRLGDIALLGAQRPGLMKQGNEAEAAAYQDKIREKKLGDVTLRFGWHCFDQSHAYRTFPDKNVLSLVSVQKQVESCESFVIQERLADSRRLTDVDGEE